MEAYTHGPSVLIVDASQENRQVLRAALERRGCRILESEHPRDGLRLVRQEQPDLVVLDVEAVEGPEQVSRDFAAASSAHTMPMILLGSARLPGPAAPGSAVVRKPYHYAPLVRKIEALLTKAA